MRQRTDDQAVATLGRGDGVLPFERRPLQPVGAVPGAPLAGVPPHQGPEDVNARRLERALVEVGKEAFLAGEYDAAEAALEQAAGIAGLDPWTWLWLARTRHALGETTEAVVAARRALELRPDWPHATEVLAALLFVNGDEAGAIRAMHELRRLVPNDTKRLGRMLARFLALRSAEDVRSLVADLLRLQPSATIVRVQAQALVEARDVARLQMLLDALPHWSIGPKIVEAAAKNFLKSDSPRDAWTLLSICNDGAVNPILVRRSAMALWRIGSVDEAIDAFDRAVGLFPNDEPLARRRRAARGEAQVLRGDWQAPAVSASPSPPAPGCILHVVRRALPYAEVGYTIRTQSIAEAQMAIGLDPHVVSQLGFPLSHGVSSAPLHEVIKGVPYHRLAPDAPLPDGQDEELSETVRELAALVAELRPALLHAASDFRSALVALAVGGAAGIPVVYEVRGFWEETWLSNRAAESVDAQIYRLRQERELDVMLRVDRIVTLSEGMRDEIVRRGIPAAKVFIVPNAVDVDAFVPVPRDEALAGELGLAPGEVVFGYISSFSAYEGIRYLIDAIGRLAERGYPVRGLLVGDGSDMPALQAQAAAHGLSGRIIFTGRVPHAEVLRYYGLIDVFVIPRTADRVAQLVTPLKPLEAMATARPVVVSGVDALRGMVVEGQTGLVFRPEDPDDLAAVLAPLVVDPDRRVALGRAAREWVGAHRTWRQNGLRYLDLYRSMDIPLGRAGAER